MKKVSSLGSHHSTYNKKLKLMNHEFKKQRYSINTFAYNKLGK